MASSDAIAAQLKQANEKAREATTAAEAKQAAAENAAAAAADALAQKDAALVRQQGELTEARAGQSSGDKAAEGLRDQLTKLRGERDAARSEAAAGQRAAVELEAMRRRLDTERDAALVRMREVESDKAILVAERDALKTLAESNDKVIMEAKQNPNWK